MGEETFRPLRTLWWRRNLRLRHLGRSEIAWAMLPAALVIATDPATVGLLIHPSELITREHHVWLLLADYALIGWVVPLLRAAGSVHALRRDGLMDQVRLTPLLPREIARDLHLSASIPGWIHFAALSLFYLALGLARVDDLVPLLMILSAHGMLCAAWCAAIGLRQALIEDAPAWASLRGLVRVGLLGPGILIVIIAVVGALPPLMQILSFLYIFIAIPVWVAHQVATIDRTMEAAPDLMRKAAERWGEKANA